MKKRPLKISLSGLEVELFTLNNQGKVIPGADTILKKVKNMEGMTAVKECSKNMLELGSYPHVHVPYTISHLLKNLETVSEITEKNDIKLCPLSTYPGKFNPSMRQDAHYKVKAKILGKENFKIAGRCVGFHFHYTLPRGVFDPETKSLKKLIRSKTKQSMVNSYNLLIAMDPALATFMQSSPFYQGHRLGKDARMIIYRGSKSLRYPHSLYESLRAFGSLSPYRFTGTDLIHTTNRRYRRWQIRLKKANATKKQIEKYSSVLMTSWNPVKINPHGTLEQRGMDMNRLPLIISTSTLIKYILKKVQEEFINVIPSDIGLDEPFKLEGDDLYITPHTYVRNKLQNYSAYKGLSSKKILYYCKRLIRLGQQILPKNRQKLMSPLKDMLNNKETESDIIIKLMKKKGYTDTIPNKEAAELALRYADIFNKELVTVRRMIERLE